MDQYTMHGGRVMGNNSPQFPRAIPPSTLSVFEPKSNIGPPALQGIQGLTPQQMMQVTNSMGHHYMHGHPHASSLPVVNMQPQYGLGGLGMIGGMNIPMNAAMGGGMQTNNHPQYSGGNPLNLSGNNYGLSGSVSSPSPSSSPGSVKRSRKNLEKNQVEVLENAFAAERYPSKQAKELIAAQSGLDYSKVVKWFDNRRTKARKTADNSSSSPYVTESPINSPAQPNHNGLNLGMPNNSSSPEGSPITHRSPSTLYSANSFNQQGGYHNNPLMSNFNDRRAAPGVSSSSAKLNNLGFSGNIEDDSMRKSIKSEISSPSAMPSDSEFLQFTRKSRTKDESWEECKDHRLYATEISNVRSGIEMRETVYANLETYLSWVIDKKKARTDTYQMIVNPDQYSGFRKEIYNLLESTEFLGESETTQGDEFVLYGNTTVSSLSIRRSSHEERDAPNRSDAKSCVTIDLLSENRTAVVRQNAPQACLRRVVLKVTNNLAGSVKFGEKPESFVIGLKAWGSPESMNNCESWGNVERLQQLLETSLKQTELLSFIFFCHQYRTNQRWFKTCMRQSMFGEEDTDYYSEGDV